MPERGDPDRPVDEDHTSRGGTARLLLQDPDTGKAKPVKLALRYELYDVLEIKTRSRLYQLVGQPGFPGPVVKTHGGTPLYDVAAVDKWHRKRKRTSKGEGRDEADRSPAAAEAGAGASAACGADGL